MFAAASSQSRSRRFAGPGKQVAAQEAKLGLDRCLVARVRLGELLAQRQTVFAGTGSRPVRLGDVQAEGKRQMTASDWIRGLRSGGPVRLG